VIGMAMTMTMTPTKDNGDRSEIKEAYANRKLSIVFWKNFLEEKQNPKKRETSYLENKLWN
jgi:hypothetical protein